MLKAFACFAGVFFIVLVAEILYRQNILKGEYQRKFIHITAGTFIAIWPWIIGFRSIRYLGAFMLIGALINYWHKQFHYSENLNRHTYGDIFFALAVFLTASLTTNKLYFTLAILNLALADGFAAVIGKKYGKNWGYMVLTHSKTVVGSMAFWIVSLCIFGVGLPFAPNLMPHYLPLLLSLPPALTIIENIPGLGSDNIFVPLAVVLILNSIAS